MYKLYKVKNTKSQIRGYWLDNGKLYKDNIIQVKYTRNDKLKEGIQALFKEGEKAVFYTCKGKGYCIDNSGQLSVYNRRLRLRRWRLSIRFFKILLAYYGGVTVYKLDNRYIIEVFYNCKKIDLNTKWARVKYRRAEKKGGAVNYEGIF